METKTVVEILKEKGIIKERPKEEEKKYKFEQEVSLKEIMMRIEKLGAEFIALKDVKFQADERIRDLSEKIGELRSMIFQRETMIKEMETKVKMLSDSVTDIEPMRIRKDMEKRKTEIESLEMKIEKMELGNKELVRKIENMENITENIRSIENLTETLKKMDDAAAKMEQTKRDVDRLSAKTERFYIETENRMKDFPQFKIRLEKVDDLSREITKSVDEINIKLGSFVSKDDMDIFKKGVNNVIVSSREKIEEQLKDVQEVLKIPEEEIINRRDNMRTKKEHILRLLATLEEQDRKGEISKSSYNELKQKNESLLKKVEEELKKLEGEKSFSIKSLPSIINELESGMTLLEQKGREMEDRLKSIEGEGVGSTMRLQTEISRNMLEKLKEVSSKISKVSENVLKSDARMNFFEILNMISRAENTTDIKSYIDELKNNVEQLKSQGLWDKKKENMVENTLAEIGESWQEYGYDDIAQVFADGLREIVPSAVKEVEEQEQQSAEEFLNIY
ncbi:MAG: hypothetical protein JW700_02740 [Candidatus Aenigmarchaeota archaeon]|nr:hypothetical protein [Candidatus Aenigmarchaeota archaeon]